ncbi:unnamed protein product [Amoebophrya sp. A120]|nr:unnamed protein product [Amoebophrya sp. A120]|eukprot:GSA120T00019138001.1
MPMRAQLATQPGANPLEAVKVGDGVKKVVFIRHGESLANVIRHKYEANPPVNWDEYSNLPLGDVPLTDKGISQALETSAKLMPKITTSLPGVSTPGEKESTFSCVASATDRLVVVEEAGAKNKNAASSKKKRSSNSSTLSTLESGFLSDGTQSTASTSSDKSKPREHESGASASSRATPSFATEEQKYHQVWVSPMRRSIETAQLIFGGNATCILRKSSTVSITTTDDDSIAGATKTSRSNLPVKSNIDRLIPSAREYFPDDFAKGASCAIVSRDYLGYDWHDAEWEEFHASDAHIEDSSRMDMLHSQILEFFQQQDNDNSSAPSADNKNHLVDTIFVVCHWGTILNYVQRFCSNLDRTASIQPYTEELKLCRGWDKISLVDPAHMDLENCAIRVVEFV